MSFDLNYLKKIGQNVLVLGIGLLTIFSGLTGKCLLLPPIYPSIDKPNNQLIATVIGGIVTLAGLYFFYLTIKKSPQNEPHPDNKSNNKTIHPEQSIDNNTSINCDNDDDNKYIANFISNNQIKEAKMIQYSGHMVQGSISRLLKKNINVRLLLQHPSMAINHFQIIKMKNFYNWLTTDCDNKNFLEIKYYKEPASVRAVQLDNKFLIMGWYTYRPHKSNKQPWLYGHNNASIRVQPTDNKCHLSKNFDTIFESLWESAMPENNFLEEIEKREAVFNTKI